MIFGKPIDLPPDRHAWETTVTQQPAGMKTPQEIAAENERLRDMRMSGAGRIAAERQRQIEVEGWTPDHDASHADGELAWAASCYARYAFQKVPTPAPDEWPWHPVWWKHDPRDPLHNLVRAGALIAAEIDKLLAGKEKTNDLA